MKRLTPHQIVAYPTESCYGLGCDPRSRRAVLGILRLKRRPQAKGLILIASHPQQLARYVTRDALQAALASGYWPGAVTLLLTASKQCPVWLRGRHATLAVRLTAYQPAARLCNEFGTALVSTSANRSGQKAMKQARYVRRAFGRQVRVISGKIGKADRPSSIRDLATGRILRR